MKLSKKEKSKMVIEAIITAGLMFLSYYATHMLFRRVVLAFPESFKSIWVIGDVMINLEAGQVFTSTPPVIILMLISVVLVTFWRLKRRYRQYQLNHIISELHYIAEGHYEHRISHDYRGDMSKVVDSIHVLVDSTVKAMEEERMIEQSKDELITNVSHDIRTPLTSIIGYLGLIEEGRYQSNEELLKYTKTAYTKAKQMKVLVDDLFEYTRVRQKTTPLIPTSFDMIQMLEQIAADFELEASKQEMEIEVVSTLTGLQMEADTEKLVRVFNNLLSNALKYGKDGKHILIEVEKEKNDAIITIKNDGKKISPKALTHLFDRFYRADESRSQETAGTGLGLAIAQSIVELHHGNISATSDKYWTRFIIRLPLNSF
ncbi:sensor histidine kinase [Desemzia sp. RIT 804]|uniref:sensor histidine kinase n=1 Tax=Desemzia sp. RIT 804 TaxID=2810209 RepID=UPI00351C2440